MKDFPNKEIVYAMTNHIALRQKKASNFEDKGSSVEKLMETKWNFKIKSYHLYL